MPSTPKQVLNRLRELPPDTESLAPGPGSLGARRARVAGQGLKKQASDAFATRAYDKALGAYEKLVELEPWELKHWLRLGDCLARLAEEDAAIEVYRWVADHYTDRGRMTQATSVYRLIIDLDPFDAAAHARLQALVPEQAPRAVSAAQIRWAAEPDVELPPPTLGDRITDELRAFLELEE